jgi:hypothetical protein
MADGGVIVDDAGAQVTRIWQHKSPMHQRAAMDDLEEPNIVTINGVQLSTFVVRAGADVCSGANVSSAVVTADNTTLTIQNKGNDVTITTTAALQREDDASVYFKNGKITDVKIDNFATGLTINGDTTVILRFA